MKVSNINIRNHNRETLTLEKAVFVEGKGIKGDKNAKGGERQISLLPLFVRKEIEDGRLTGLCIPRFTENITYTSNHSFEVGEVYKIGEALIEISSIRKRCFPECENIIKNKPCPLIEYVAYGKIILGGTINLNDGINLNTSEKQRL